MAGKGRVPKDKDHKLGHANGKRDEPTKISFDPVTGPDLPGEGWHPQTLVWWDNLRFSPLADLLMDADWQFLLDTALIHHRFWESGGSTAFAAELRLRVGKIGVTPEERRHLRVEATQEGPAESEPTAESDATTQRRRGMRIAG